MCLKDKPVVCNKRKWWVLFVFSKCKLIASLKMGVSLQKSGQVLSKPHDSWVSGFCSSRLGLSAVVSIPPHILACCVFQKALLLTTAVKCHYLTYFFLTLDTALHKNTSRFSADSNGPSLRFLTFEVNINLRTVHKKKVFSTSRYVIVLFLE